MSENEIDEAVAKHINDVSGQTIELQEKIKLRTTPINKLEPRIELLF